jgi:DNA-binding transcriptional regulator GbsR (MarR family)
MGGYWGINRVMAEIYAILYVSESPMTLEDMSNKLKTSRSNISLNVRGLIELGVVNKVVIRGDRKDYYSAEDNIGKIAKLLAVAKKKRELDPAMEIISEALAAARTDDGSTPPSDQKLFVEKLEQLKLHMDFVNSIFLSFVGNETAGEAGLSGMANITKTTGKTES